MKIPDEVLGHAVWDEGEQLVREDCGQGKCIVLPPWVLELIIREKEMSYQTGRVDTQIELRRGLGI